MLVLGYVCWWILVILLFGWLTMFDFVLCVGVCFKCVWLVFVA